MRFEQVPIYHVDVTLTDDCNFACKYCFERGQFNTHTLENVDLFIRRMDELLESLFFKTNYKMLNIGFWGGEPTLRPDLINTIVKKYWNDERVKFFVYSNGYDIDSILDLVVAHKDTMLLGGHPKFFTQISYDGMPIHDIDRVLRGGKLTSTIVRQTILELDKLGVPSTIKSTVTPATFKYLYSAYEDILDIWNSGKDKQTIRNSTYFPTIDYHNLEKYTESELEVAKKELEDSLVKIAKREIEHTKKYNRFFLSWFGGNKALCSAGRDMVTVDWDGKTYKCHGCVYDEEKESHLVSSLSDADFIKKLEESNKFHCQDFGFLPIECKNCDAPFCLKCNVVKFEHSDKTQYLDKWRDYPVQKTLCDFYHINGKVWKAINQILKEN